MVCVGGQWWATLVPICIGNVKGFDTLTGVTERDRGTEPSVAITDQKFTEIRLVEIQAFELWTRSTVQCARGKSPWLAE